MSLQLDTVFMAAIEANEKVMDIIGGRRWCTAAASPIEEFISNVQVPYLIVNYDGMSSEPGTKDDDFDSGCDTVNISITVTGNTPEQLGDLATSVRRAVHHYLNAHVGEAGMPTSAIPSAGEKVYNDVKPCYAIELHWQCAVDFDLNDAEDDEQEPSNG